MRFWQWVARKDQCQTQLVPASSATDLPQDTAEPISEAGGASCESVFKEKQKYLTGRGEGNKGRVGNNTGNSQGRRGGAPWWSRHPQYCFWGPEEG